MKVGIFYNNTNQQSVITISELKKLLQENNIDFCDMEQSQCDKLPDGLQYMIVFGGDGSVLRSAKIVNDLPIIAINTGNLGFLTSFERDQLQEMILALKSGSLNYSKRRLLKVVSDDDVYYALNDAVIIKNYQYHRNNGCVRVKLFIDGSFMDKYISDGIVFATPTGSTAYALSAGGPVLTPDIEAVVTTPICAHSLHSRPIVFSSKMSANAFVCEDSEVCSLYIDGGFCKDLMQKDNIEISLSEKYVSICDNNVSFFEKLNKKMISWTAKENCDEQK